MKDRTSPRFHQDRFSPLEKSHIPPSRLAVGLASLALCLCACSSDAPTQPAAAPENATAGKSPSNTADTDNAASPQDSQYVPPGYVKSWNDEFEGNELDRSKWNYREGGRPVVAHRRENVSVEDGKLVIELRKGEVAGFPNIPDDFPQNKKHLAETKDYSTGGVISRKGFKGGYFELRANLPETQGWHPSWWMFGSDQEGNLPGTTWNPHDHEGPRLEIDVFERPSSFGPAEVEFNMVIHRGWAGFMPIHKVHKTFPFDLSDDYHVFGLEWSEDFIVFYFDGEIVNIASMEGIPFHLQHHWIGATITGNNLPERDDELLVDYFRAYEIEDRAYSGRLAEIEAILEARAQDEDRIHSAAASEGTDLWVDPTSLPHIGQWKVWSYYNDPDYPEILMWNLRGQFGEKSDLDREDLTAGGRVEIPEAGKYRLWVRSYDPKETPGSRSFQVLVDGKVAKPDFGGHGQAGYAWEDGGVFELPAGPVSLEVYDRSQRWVRVQRILLTTDLDYVPEGPGGTANAQFLEPSR